MTGPQFIAGVALVFVSIGVEGHDQVKAAEAEKLEFFENKVRPLLVEHCYG